MKWQQEPTTHVRWARGPPRARCTTPVFPNHLSTSVGTREVNVGGKVVGFCPQSLSGVCSLLWICLTKLNAWIGQWQLRRCDHISGKSNTYLQLAKAKIFTDTEMWRTWSNSCMLDRTRSWINGSFLTYGSWYRQLRIKWNHTTGRKINIGARMYTHIFYLQTRATVCK